MIGSYKVTYTDGSECVYQGKQGDVVRFEQHFDMSLAQAFRPAAVAAEVSAATGKVPTVEVKITHVWYLAYCAAKRNGREESFEDWLDLTDSIEQVESAGPLGEGSTTTPESSE